MAVEIAYGASIDRACLPDRVDRIVDGKSLRRMFLDHGERVLEPASDRFVEHDVLQVLKLVVGNRTRRGSVADDAETRRRAPAVDEIRGEPNDVV